MFSLGFVRPSIKTFKKFLLYPLDRRSKTFFTQKKDCSIVSFGVCCEFKTLIGLLIFSCVTLSSETLLIFEMVTSTFSLCAIQIREGLFLDNSSDYRRPF